jgi:hypothetical protein
VRKRLARASVQEEGWSTRTTIVYCKHEGANSEGADFVVGFDCFAAGFDALEEEVVVKTPEDIAG